MMKDYVYNESIESEELKEIQGTKKKKGNDCLSRTIKAPIWQDSKIQDLNPYEKLLFIYCLTNQYTNLCGIYEISKKTICFELDIKKEELNNCLKTLNAKNIVRYDEESNEIYVVNYMKHNSHSIKHAISSFEHFKKVKSKYFIQVLALTLYKCFNVNDDDKKATQKQYENLKQKLTLYILDKLKGESIDQELAQFINKYLHDLNIPYQINNDNLTIPYVYHIDTLSIPYTYPTDTVPILENRDKSIENRDKSIENREENREKKKEKSVLGLEEKEKSLKGERGGIQSLSISELDTIANENGVDVNDVDIIYNKLKKSNFIDVDTGEKIESLNQLIRYIKRVAR